MKPRARKLSTWATRCWSPASKTSAGSTAPYRRAACRACSTPREHLTSVRCTYASASSVTLACSKNRSSYWSRGRPRAAALPRPFASTRAYPSSESTEVAAPTWAPLSSTTKKESLMAPLRRNHVVAACPRLFAAEMCNLVSIVSGGVASSRREFHTQTLRMLTELPFTARSTGKSQSPALTGGMTIEASVWRCYMLPFVGFLRSALNDTLVTGSSLPSSSSSSLADGDWEEALLGHICDFASWPDAEAAETVTQLMEFFTQFCAQQKCFSPGLPQSTLETCVRRVVEATSPALLFAVVQTFQVRPPVTHSVGSDIVEEFPSPAGALYASLAEENFHGGCQWQSFMSDRAIKVCLQKIVQVLTNSSSDRRKGKAGDVSAVTPAARLQLQQCCLCQLPHHMDARTRHECAMLIMTALKCAPLTVLLAAYRYLDAERLNSAVVAQRFLAHCGVCVTHGTQRGVSLMTYLSPVARKGAAEALLHAYSTVLRTGQDAKQMEASMSYAVATLNALGFPHIVRSLYKAPMSVVTTAPTSELLETPYSVLSQVLLQKVSDAVIALEALGASRPKGWVSLPASATESMVAVSRLVGQEGTSADVDKLYAALVGFHNAGLFISYYMECVLAGLCDRMRELGKQKHASGGAGKGTGPSPHEVLEQVIPVAQATLHYVGDELNADMILELIETALQSGGYAVPLTAALVAALRASMGRSLSLQELLGRMDASTHHLPFLYYYTLCYARDFSSHSTFDHLTSLWRIDGDAIWHRASHLSPSCRLWKCASCGRLNSDRYNYCVCSALRYSHVFCGGCGYAQDERLRECRSCGQALLSQVSVAGAVARKAWQCRDCGARNPARQTLLCFRCRQLTGPCVRQHTASAAATCKGATVSTAGECKTCCICDEDRIEGCGVASVEKRRRSDAGYAAAVGVCHECGRFQMDNARRKSTVWVCIGCHQRRSSLERVCPSCPQVECLPRAECREPVNAPRMCRHCSHEEWNPFKVMCVGCGSSANPFGAIIDAPEIGPVSGQMVVATGQVNSEYGQGVLSQGQQRVFHWCVHCHHLQVQEDAVPLHQQRCTGCGDGCNEKGLCSLPWRICDSCGESLPTRYAGSAVCPYCAAYVAQAPQSQSCNYGDAQSYWTAVALHHTCEVLDGCCTRESLLTESCTQSTSTAAANSSAPDGAAAPQSAAPTVGAGTDVYLQRRPTIERTLARLRREWCNLSSDAWLSTRMDTVTLLGRAVNRLSSRIPTSLTARRLSALLKSILTHVDDVCGVAVTGYRDTSSHSVQGYFTAVELCHECLGTHPSAFCPFLEDGGQWKCGECGHSNNNSDVCRYVCGSCLTLRPLMQDLLISACWQCHACDRANVQLERYCMHCGAERASWSKAMLTCWSLPDGATFSGAVEGDSALHGPDVLQISDRDDAGHKMNRFPVQQGLGNGQRNAEGQLGLGKKLQEEPPRIFCSASSDDVSGASSLDPLVGGSTDVPASGHCGEIPFTPTKCPLCGLVYIEARCPLCLNHIPDLADARGTVCEVQDRCAFIQPNGTTRLQDRIFVNEALAQANSLRTGLHVHYTAELGQRGMMEARFLRR